MCSVPHKIIFAGGIEEKSYHQVLLSKIRELGLENSVYFIGRIPFHHMNDAYHASFIQAFPTREEGLGQIVIEAGLCGVPTIGARVGGVPELVHNGVNGYLINSGDINSLEAHLGFLLTHEKKCRELGDHARIDFMHKFNASTIAKRHLEIYSELIKNRKN